MPHRAQPSALVVDGEIDVADPGPRCDPNAEFGAGVGLTNLNTADSSEDGATLSPDELTIYYSKITSATSVDIWTATRATLDEVFMNPKPLPGAVNTASYERHPSVTADGQTMYLYSEVTSGDYQLMVAARSPSTGNFGVATKLGIAGADGYVLPGHQALYFSGRGPDLWRSARNNNAFDPPVLVPGAKLNSPDNEGAPVVSADELTIYFSTSRTANYESFTASRSSALGEFGEPTPVTILNTTEIEFPSWISSDGCVLYFTRMQSGRYDLFVATRLGGG